MLYYFKILVNGLITDKEYFEGNEEDAIKYMGYKEQVVREINNWNKSEKDKIIITSNYIIIDNINKINSEIINKLETKLQNISTLRSLLIDSIHKIKEF
jgi:predicted butyrate kinase (DUF1464 family)